MKRVLFSALFSISTFIATAQCTLNDYNYITKGYMTSLQQGLDFKKGYSMKKLFTGMELKLTNNNQFEFHEFTHESKPDSIIAFMAVLKQNGAATRVFCIPGFRSDNELFEKCYNDLIVLDQRLKDRFMKDWIYLTTQVYARHRKGK